MSVLFPGGVDRIGSGTDDLNSFTPRINLSLVDDLCIIHLHSFIPTSGYWKWRFDHATLRLREMEVLQ